MFLTVNLFNTEYSKAISGNWSNKEFPGFGIEFKLLVLTSLHLEHPR